MSFPSAVSEKNVDNLSQSYDVYILISNAEKSAHYSHIESFLNAQKNVDARIGNQAVLTINDSVPGSRLISAGVGSLDRDYDDVRRVFDAAKQVAQLLMDVGCVKPLMEVNLVNLDEEQTELFQNAVEAAFLGLCQGLWQPLEARQALGEAAVEPVQSVGVLAQGDVDTARLNAIEAGKRVARDLCGTEPERMAPPGFADYCVDAFKESNVKVEVVEDHHEIAKDYPLLHAVARASIEVIRHRPRIIRMVYEGEGEITKTLMFAGKGITFDTGGADLKVNGHMAGMSRDKGGAAGVAGFMKTVSKLAPKNLKVIVEIGAVRNSIGAEAFIPDEIIQSHAGIRVRVGNTDAEGRMLLADLLSHLRVQAVDEINPELFSVATLTGHAAMAFGPYSALVENKAAKQQQIAKKLFEKGELCADPVEPSLSRREDFDFVRPRTKADDVLSSNNAPSVTTVRGHQFPMAFLSIASGLDKHQASSEMPLAYTHVDIAGSGVENLDWQHGKPTGAPVNVFVNTYL